MVANEKSLSHKTVEVAQILSWPFVHVLGTAIENHGYHICLYVVAFTMLVCFMHADNTDRVVGGTVGGLFGGIGVVLFGALIVVVILYLCLHRKKEKLMKVH